MTRPCGERLSAAAPSQGPHGTSPYLPPSAKRTALCSGERAKRLLPINLKAQRAGRSWSRSRRQQEVSRCFQSTEASLILRLGLSPCSSRGSRSEKLIRNAVFNLLRECRISQSFYSPDQHCVTCQGRRTRNVVALGSLSTASPVPRTTSGGRPTPRPSSGRHGLLGLEGALLVIRPSWSSDA